ncbi:M48 family metallopeptidase [Dactylosporangium sp. NPDC049140]|uniref:M48 family metallopeptidase n=1 Tax=Dactylosporangium sp. NPDC049140 TaxID=3155647 RepID=UPI0033C377A8
MEMVTGWAAVDRRLDQRAHARDDQLAAELAGHAAAPPGWSLARVVVTLAAALIQLTALAALGFGAWLCVRHFPSAGLLPGVVLLAFGAVLLPRPAGLSRYATRLDRAAAPHLFAFVDGIAAAVGVSSPRLIVLDDRFDADGGTTGLLRRRYLRLGVPLFAVLDPAQRAALVAHQLAHLTDGDPLRTGIAGSVDRSLTALVTLFEPRPETAIRPMQDPAIIKAIASAGGGARLSAAAADVWYAELLLRPVIAVLRWISAGGRLLVVGLARSDVHRAEYFADAEAARIAGTAAMRAVLDTLAQREAVLTVLRRHVRAGDDQHPDVAAWPELARQVRAHATGERPDSTSPLAGHPPIVHRVRLLESRPEVAVAEAGQDGVDADLATEYRRLARDLRYG